MADDGRPALTVAANALCFLLQALCGTPACGVSGQTVCPPRVPGVSRTNALCSLPEVPMAYVFYRAT